MKTRELTEDEREMVESAIIGARRIAPYYQRAFAALTPVAADGLGTIGVDKFWRLYVDPVWFQSLDPKHRAGAIAHHEIEHLLRDHAGRLPTDYPKLANVAGDLEIDDDAPPDMLPRAKLHGEFGLPDGLLAEEYYARIMDMAEHVQCQCSGGSGAGAPLEGELDGEGATAGVKPEEAESLRDAVAGDVRAHRQAGGHVPDSVGIWADARIRPVEHDWRRELASIVGGAVRSGAAGRSDWSYSRLHRRQRVGEVLRPGTVKMTPKVEVIVDTSGSMGGDGDVVLSTVEAISKAGVQMRVTQWDTDARRVSTGKPQVWVGGGGTDLAPAIEAADRSGVTCIVVVTDGETPWPAQPTQAQMIVVLTHGSPSIPEWAKVVRP